MSPMTSDRYRLTLGSFDLGQLTIEDRDFPWTHGRWDAPDASTVPAPVQAYIAYSIESDQVFHRAGEDAWLAFMHKHEEKHVAVILSDDWCLEDSSGDRHPIPVP